MGCGCSGVSSGCHKIPGRVCPAIGACPRAGQPKCFRTDDAPPPGMGRIVWPSTLEDFKRRLDPSFRATDAAVQQCERIEAGARIAWGQFYAAWRSFCDAPTPWLGLGSAYDDAEAYQAQLGGWQEQLRQSCTVPGPVVSPEDPNVGMQSAIRWGSAAVIVAAIVIGVRTVLK